MGSFLSISQEANVTGEHTVLSTLTINKVFNVNVADDFSDRVPSELLTKKIAHLNYNIFSPQWIQRFLTV
jgi:hypothetical protein